MFLPALSALRNAAGDNAAPFRVLSVILSLGFALAILYGLFLFFYFLLRRSYRALRRMEKSERPAGREQAGRAAETDGAETETSVESDIRGGKQSADGCTLSDFSEKSDKTDGEAG